MDSTELNILKKYENGRIVDGVDIDIVHRLQSMGLMKGGVHEDEVRNRCGDREIELYETAKTTKLGIQTMRYF